MSDTIRWCYTHSENEALAYGEGTGRCWRGQGVRPGACDVADALVVRADQPTCIHAYGCENTTVCPSVMIRADQPVYRIDKEAFDSDIHAEPWTILLLDKVVVRIGAET